MAKYLNCTCGHCKAGIEGANETWRLLEDVTFWELSLVCLVDIKIDLSYDPAIAYFFLAKQRFCKYQLILWPDLNFSSESSSDKDANRCKSFFYSSSGSGDIREKHIPYSRENKRGLILKWHDFGTSLFSSHAYFRVMLI